MYYFQNRYTMQMCGSRKSEVITPGRLSRIKVGSKRDDLSLPLEVEVTLT